MKWIEITEANKKQPGGTYAAVRFDDETVDALLEYTKTNKIPKPLEADGFHTTLLFSRKHLPDYTAQETYDEPMKGHCTGCELWKGHSDASRTKKSHILVMTYDCPALHDHHKALMKEHDAQYDFDEYKPHITLSYDAEGFDPSTLPKFKHPIRIVGEHSEDLDAD